MRRLKSVSCQGFLPAGIFGVGNVARAIFQETYVECGVLRDEFVDFELTVEKRKAGQADVEAVDVKQRRGREQNVAEGASSCERRLCCALAHPSVARPAGIRVLRCEKREAGWLVGEKSKKTTANPSFWLKTENEEKKRSSQASWKHAAWELLSPDLRCFWKQFCGNAPK